MTSQILDGVKKEMERTIAILRKELARVRTGRASTALLEAVTVDYYGTRTPLHQLAALSAPEPRLLVVQPYDKTIMADIEKAIYQSDLGLTPVNDGRVIRIPIPELTEERRRELVRHVRKVAEEFRVSVRTHRREANDMLKGLLKEKKISEDTLRGAQEKVQDVTTEFIEKIDKILKAKEDEIMAV